MENITISLFFYNLPGTCFLLFLRPPTLFPPICRFLSSGLSCGVRQSTLESDSLLSLLYYPRHGGAGCLGLTLARGKQSCKQLFF